MTEEKRKEELERHRKEKLGELANAESTKKVEGKKRRAQPNSKSSFATVDEEMAGRQSLVEDCAKVAGPLLQKTLDLMSRVPDPRRPGSIKHSIKTLLAYGILLFALRISSRRDANRELSQPTLWENLKAIVPGLETMPHADTLANLLEKMDCDQLQEQYGELLKDLIRRKKFRNFLRRGRYVVAVDGSQKTSCAYQWAEEALRRKIGEGFQYYACVLEAVLILDNGITLPLYTEFLSNEDWVPGQTKQDCESKAFKRLAPKLRQLLGKNVMLLADGIYACEPVISTCRNYGWEYMITFKEGCMPSVWEEAECLIASGLAKELGVKVGDRHQLYQWANDIGADATNPRAKTRHVVFCTEMWDEKHPVTGAPDETKYTTYAWLSSSKLTRRGVVDLCNHVARKRWAIESNFHVEKHGGYGFEHNFSYNWNAMKGFHYLMKAAHCINALVIGSELFAKEVTAGSIGGFLTRISTALKGALLDIGRIREAMAERFQWRLNPRNVFYTPV